MASLDRASARRGYSWSAYGNGSTRVGAKYSANSSAPFSRPIYAHSLSRQVPMTLVLCGMLFLFGFATLTQVAESARAAKEVSALKKELTSILADNELLAKDISELESATRIRSLAINRLGMVEPLETRTVEMPQQAVAVSAPATYQTEWGSWLSVVLKALGGV